MHRLWVAILLVLGTGFVRADGPMDNLPDKVRRIPPAGVAIPDGDRKELAAGVAALAKEIEDLKTTLKGKPALLELLPDVQVYHKAVDWALRYDEFLNQKNVAAEIKAARGHLKTGVERAQALKDGKAPWTTTTGLVVRGYVSRIDGSVQPYGLVVPPTYKPDYPHHYRLDIWCHGRGETLTELEFIRQRQANPGEFTPPNAFVLHPYGRYCNANKFAGEVDVLEALDHVQKHYPIDENRVAMRGFSMGGAACWQFAVHYPDRWCAAAPGAGFSETPEFLNVFQNEKVEPTWYEKKLWQLYDCPGYASNLFSCPTVAYSGEIDRQKQAADVMARALQEHKIELVHIIGPKTGHSYHPEAKREVNRRIDALAARGRDRVPSSIHFTTYTLRYNRCFWLSVDELGQHWEPARVDADLASNHVGLFVKNVTALTIALGPGDGPPPASFEARYTVRIDHATLDVNRPLSDRSWTIRLRKDGEKWQVLAAPDDSSLRKRHGLQGPIDDAFMDRFLMVRPTGQPLHDQVGRWANAELTHALEHWRRHFRGDAPVKDDTAVSDADIAENHLVLWGDPASNALLKKIVDQLPVKWTGDAVQVGADRYDAGHHVPVLVYPNPLNPKKYVVLNSGFTFREYDYLNNARQVPKLPDFAVFDINSPVTSRAPGKVVTAGFFDERWQLPAKK